MGTSHRQASRRRLRSRRAWWTRSGYLRRPARPAGSFPAGKGRDLSRPQSGANDVGAGQQIAVGIASNFSRQPLRRRLGPDEHEHGRTRQARFRLVALIFQRQSLPGGGFHEAPRFRSVRERPHWRLPGCDCDRYSDMPGPSVRRISRCTLRDGQHSARNMTACPAELPPPTTATSVPSYRSASTVVQA